MIKTTSIVIISIVVVLLIYMFPRQALNPGDLSKGHERLENACMKCHTVFLGTQGKKCVSCHKLTDIGRITTTGARMEENIAQGKAAFHHLFQEDSCLSCHTDHAGKSADKTVRPFSHNMLQGKNINQCMTCHQRPADKLHENNNQECSQCHSGDRWRPATLDHAQYFRFDGNHKSECQSCHRDNNYREYTCYGCHEHSAGKIEKEHREEGISNYQDCAACHPSGNEHDIRRGYPAGRSPVQTWTSRQGGEETRKEVYRDPGYNYYGRDADNGNHKHHDKEEEDDDDDHDREHDKHDKQDGD